MEVSPPEERLETLKYSELQSLAKALGLKANLKAEKLLNALKQHFHEEVQENGSMVSNETFSASDVEESDSNQMPTNLSMVTKRRRKSNCHKIPEDQKENEPLQNAGSGKTLEIYQDEYLTNSKTTGNLVAESVTPGQKPIESDTPVSSLSGKKPYKGNLPKSGRRGALTTPNFKRIHEAQFKKMQSIDDYVERKNKMTCNISNSVKEDKVRSRGVLFSPCHHQRNRLSPPCTPILRRSPRNSSGTSNKSILSQKSKKSVFSSTGLSATKTNVRFSESTKDNEHKRSLTKTPSRKPPFLSGCTPDTQKSNEDVIIRKNITGSATKCQLKAAQRNSCVAPFKSVSNIAEPTSTKKPVFDLQASLSRPLNYQPHRGKLKPWGNSKENKSICPHKRAVKQPILQTREERRQKLVQERKQKKDQMLGTRRGLSAV
ncbi:nucleolar and spindle-associated protein 1 isoform X1 [Anolis sagrei]|uniref:nucleolar and spindle-associated protein 1 isoform X1 n=1 Tax=Anolis sagrei TaxID=38937 RepID=UPI0035227321